MRATSDEAPAGGTAQGSKGQEIRRVDSAIADAERKSTDTALAEAALAGLNVHRLASGKLLVVQGLAVEHDADSLRRLVRALGGFA